MGSAITRCYPYLPITHFPFTHAHAYAHAHNHNRNTITITNENKGKEWMPCLTGKLTCSLCKLVPTNAYAYATPERTRGLIPMGAEADAAAASHMTYNRSVSIVLS